MSREELFLSQRDVIERAIAWVSSRRGLHGADAEDFASVVKLRFIENDYEVLAKFEGRSSLKTYLVAVINRMYLDYQVQRFGKWRPSAKARRLGPPAPRLERLMFRDGMSFDEAYSVLQTDPRVTETRDALYAISQALPNRPCRGCEGEGKEPVTAETAASLAERAERQALAERTLSVVRQSLKQLPALDRLFFRLHFEQGLTVAQAARSLGLEQKPLYPRKEAILARLRADVEAGGVRSEDAQELLSTVDWDVALAWDESNSVLPTENSGPGPSQGHGSGPPPDGEP